jgi:ketosteroid isomerase-like protein
MRILISSILAAAVAATAYSQTGADKIYETERAFASLVAEKGIRAGFLEYLTTDAVMFLPDAVNAREEWTRRPPSPAALTWEPILIDVSANGLYAYSIGNSIYRPKGKDDTAAYHGHYISVWRLGPDGRYKAVFDTGINHEAPAATPIAWKDKTTGVSNEKRMSVAHAAAGFFAQSESEGALKAYKRFLADDAIVMRDGALPFVGSSAAVAALRKQKGSIKFDKRQSMIESDDFAYHHSKYAVIDKPGKETEKGNYVQVWRFRGGRWVIVADVFVPMPANSK